MSGLGNSASWSLARGSIFLLLIVSVVVLVRQRPPVSPAAFGVTAQRKASAETTSVAIQIDGAIQHQVMEGFGASLNSEVIGNTDVLTASQRARALDAAYNQVRIRTGQAPTVLEAPVGGPEAYDRRTNDDGDPFSLKWDGFNKFWGDTFKQKVVDLTPPQANANIYPDVHINIRWASPWLKTIRSSDYNRFLDECAEQVLAGLTYWKNTYGQEPQFAMLFNEPTTGNGELDGGSDQQIIDIIKRAGVRLRSAGFNTVKFVGPSQETEQTSLSTARAMLADPDARQYIGAISYHPYPYGSTYSYVPNILRSSGSGNPDHEKVALRNQLRDLGNQYGLPVWMNEVSNGVYGGPPPGFQSFDFVRGRAIHIHDELTYADAAAYYGMQTLGSTTSERMHGLPPVLYSDGIVQTRQENDTVTITEMGYAIGHYARWITRGAIRIDSLSDDPLVQVTAFRDPVQKRVVLVVINNDSAGKNLNVALNGLAVTGTLSGEQSTTGSYWQPLSGLSPASSTNFTVTVPALSVTTFSGDVGVVGVVAPKITSASVSGKKLFVSGESFDNGAVVLLNGEKQKTRNDEQNPAGLLIAKKAGKKIAHGQTVSLQVRNVDGTLSDEFPFTRSG